MSAEGELLGVFVNSFKEVVEVHSLQTWAMREQENVEGGKTSTRWFLVAVGGRNEAHLFRNLWMKRFAGIGL
jgi:hypothetical protein